MSNDNKQLAAYEIIEVERHPHKHTIAILVDNEFGVLSRVIDLFAARGYNIESLTVNEVDKEKNLSRITIITLTDDETAKHIMNLLHRIIPVHEVRDLMVESPHIEREVGLIKVMNDDQKSLDEALHIATRFGARTVDSSNESFIFEISDMPEKIDKFIGLLRPLGIREVCRTGATAIARGTETIEFEQAV